LSVIAGRLGNECDGQRADPSRAKRFFKEPMAKTALTESQNGRDYSGNYDFVDRLSRIQP
jgi:hypothetical protein